MKYLSICILALLSSCTISVTTVHTQGQASDVVDEQQTPTNTVSPNFTVPMNAL